MTATQAPTPGPLSKSLGQKAYERMRDHNDNAFPEMNDSTAWESLTPSQRRSWEEDASERPHLYGLAPTAPVEASGSEREGLIERLRAVDNGTAHERPWIATELCDEAANALEALRPQPSGETREQIVSAIREHIELGEIGSCSAEIVGHEEAADAILALLSARPLALGGQQGDA